MYLLRLDLAKAKISHARQAVEFFAIAQNSTASGLTNLRPIAMSFVDAFYSFSLEINNPESGVYQKVRVRLAKHPLETLQHLSARVIAYMHAYTPGLELSVGLFQADQPDISKIDITDELLVWAAVGDAQRPRLQRLLKQNPQARFSIYFYSSQQIENFCHQLRGSKSNWVSRISFFQIESGFTEDFAQLLSTSNNVTATVLDYSLYLSISATTLVGVINSVNIWDKYQISIGNLAV